MWFSLYLLLPRFSFYSPFLFPTPHLSGAGRHYQLIAVSGLCASQASVLSADQMARRNVVHVCPTMRHEFPRSVKVAVLKRATRGGIVYCEQCGAPATKCRIDHIIADSHGGGNTIDNAQLLGKCCYEAKDANDISVAAKIKRIEAKHLGANTPRRPLKSRNMLASERTERDQLPLPPRRPLYRDID